MADKIEDDKPPALPAMMMVEIMREIADGEVIISERLRKKADLEKFLAREDVTTVLDIEAEVGQEVFVYAIKMMKVMVGERISSIFEQQEDASLTGMNSLRGLLISSIDDIKPRNPYKGDDQDA